MSHPKDRRERFLIGKKHGERRARGYWGGYDIVGVGRFDVEGFRAHAARRRRDTTKLCSCEMCGNQRRHYGKTMQERKFYEAADLEQAGVAQPGRATVL